MSLIEKKYIYTETLTVHQLPAGPGKGGNGGGGWVGGCSSGFFLKGLWIPAADQAWPFFTDASSKVGASTVERLLPLLLSLLSPAQESATMARESQFEEENHSEQSVHLSFLWYCSPFFVELFVFTSDMHYDTQDEYIGYYEWFGGQQRMWCCWHLLSLWFTLLWLFLIISHPDNPLPQFLCLRVSSTVLTSRRPGVDPWDHQAGDCIAISFLSGPEFLVAE